MTGSCASTKRSRLSEVMRLGHAAAPSLPMPITRSHDRNHAPPGGQPASVSWGSVTQLPAELCRRLSQLAPEDAPERSHIAHADIREDLIDAAPALGKEPPHGFDPFQLQVLSRRDAVGLPELAV